jgi:hypothetical protein
MLIFAVFIVATTLFAVVAWNPSSLLTSSIVAHFNAILTQAGG